MDKVYNKKAFKTTIGGQAIFEGVMMRGPSKTAIAVRKPDGDIIIKEELNNDLSKKYKILSFPIIRGAYKLVDAMKVGVNAMTYSASFFDEEIENKREEKRTFKNLSKDKKEDFQMLSTILFSFVLAIGLFMVIPSISAGFLKNYITSPILLNLIEGIIRLIVFFIYLFYVSKVDEISRVFMYHGSEHKTIHCYEAGEELTVENVKKFPIVHPRCGTSFLFMVMLISIIVLSFFGWPSPLVRVITRIIAMPIIAGISYEINRLIGKNDSKICKILAIPGLEIQRFATVKEPDASMIEVAIESLKRVLPKEGESDLWT